MLPLALILPLSAPLAPPQIGFSVLQMDKVLPTAADSGFAAAGSGVASDGETLLVGYDGSDTLEVFTAGIGGWSHTQTLTAPDPAVAAAFPRAFDVDGDWLVVAAADRAWTFSRSAGLWTVDQELDPQEAVGLGNFGYWPNSIDLHGDLVVIGAAHAYAEPGLGWGRGAAFAFERVGATWTLSARLSPADSLTHSDQFGKAVATDGTRIVVGDDTGISASGAYGRAVIFERSGGGWVEEAVIPPLLVNTWGRWGTAVDIEGDVVAVGTGTQVGQAGVWRKTGGSWNLMTRVTPSGGAYWFGEDVVLERNLLFVGASGRQGSFPQPEGRVYVFAQDQGQWLEAAQVEAYDSFNGMSFGRAIAATDRALLVASPAILGATPAVYGASFCPELGQTYCSANPNSTGFAAEICAVGSPALADQDLRLIGHNVPPAAFGYFLMSQGQDFVAGFGGSQGNLCLGGGQLIYRYNQNILQAAGPGTVYMDLPWTSLPFGSQIQAGDTWNFQLWYRDLNPSNTSNTTPGMSIAFQ